MPWTATRERVRVRKLCPWSNASGEYEQGEWSRGPRRVNKIAVWE
ncbi:hypothetical protein J31TS3_10540 [Paenibacillus lactis]|nr:hypothetical protein J31TS3_10540 [Paenibacillus lactis]